VIHRHHATLKTDRWRIIHFIDGKLVSKERYDRARRGALAAMSPPKPDETMLH
jgi:hypothetical protein